MKSSTLKSIALACALVSAGPVSASVLFGSDYTSLNTNSSLFAVNQTTGAATLIGNIGRSIGDLTNVNNVLVGIDISSNTLYAINPITGAAGASGLAVTGTRGPITSIAWDPVSHVLYGNTTTGFGGADILYTINTTTGAATTVGALGVPDLFGLGFRQGGQLIASDTTGNVYGVNTGTGAATLIGLSGVCCLYDDASRPEDNVLFASNAGTGLVRINPATGLATAVGPYGAGQNIAGLAFLAAVPEPAAWAMMVGGFLMLGAALRRRRITVSYSM